jgi:hypothetical protein
MGLLQGEGQKVVQTHALVVMLGDVNRIVIL